MNAVAVSPEVNITSIHDRAVLAYISCSTWSARKLDRKATEDVTSSKGAVKDAARVNKHLLASADDLLKKITKIGADARRFLEANSLPWDDAGNRLLSNDKMMDVVAKVTKMKHEYDAAVEEFVVEYPALRAQALDNLGELANDSEYPQPDVVRGKFNLRLSITPLPTGFGDIRTGLQPMQVAALEAQYTARVRMQFNVALEDAWKRLRTDVVAILDRMGTDDAGKGKVFRNSLFENVRDTAKLLKSLNVFDDPNLESIRFEVEQYLCTADAEQVRSSDAVREATKFHAQTILDKMASILGE